MTSASRWVFGVVLSVLWCATGGPAAAEDLSAQRILERMDQVIYGFDDQIMDVKMTVVDTDGSSKSYQFTIYQKGAQQRLVRFTSGEVQGMATLVESPTRMYVYLPGFKKVRQVAAHAMGQTFAGSDYTMDDISNPTFASRYQAALDREDDHHWYLVLTPKSGENPLYPRVEITVQKGTFFQNETRYFDEKGRLVKTMSCSEPKDYHGRSRYSVIVLKDARTGHSTRFDILDFRVNQGLKDSMFTVRELQWSR